MLVSSIFAAAKHACMPGNLKFGKLVTVAQGYFVGLAITWFLVSFFVGGYFNYIALLTAILFIAQLYFKNRIANLALGIVILPAAIFWGLQFVAMGGSGGFDMFVNVMLFLSLASIVFSIILVFGYIRLSMGEA
jgi:hypothetical protein